MYLIVTTDAALDSPRMLVSVATDAALDSPRMLVSVATDVLECHYVA